MNNINSNGAPPFGYISTDDDLDIAINPLVHVFLVSSWWIVNGPNLKQPVLTIEHKTTMEGIK